MPFFIIRIDLAFNEAEAGAVSGEIRNDDEGAKLLTPDIGIALAVLIFDC
ncbi:MAG: hypothetical protein IPK89_10025 [Sphingomonadales bacterium]|nr:hypothetical protein [Sphingomonadales bacterium]